MDTQHRTSDLCCALATEISRDRTAASGNRAPFPGVLFTMSNTMINTPPAERLTRIREGLAGLHRALVNAERLELEQETGRLAPAQYLRFLLDDPRFAWLRPMGRLVAALDERLHSAETTGNPVSEEDARAWSAEVARLIALRLSLEAGWRYREWLQRDPGVVLAHAALAAALRPGATELAA